MRNLYTFVVVVSVATSLVCCGRQTGEVSHPEWSYNSVIYEMNIRQYTSQGTLAAAEEHLPRLSQAGFDLIWLMPVQPIGVTDRKGDLGSYYSISDYRAVNPEFGTMDDIRHFVATAHSLGQHVILDWVANHTSRDAVWVDEHPDWFERDSLGEIVRPHGWDDVAALDYTNPAMRAAMIDEMRFWIESVGFDGLRCDVAWNVPVDFWNEAVAKLKEVRPDIFMLAEAEMPELHDKAFDMTYAWKFHHLINKIAAGGANADSLRQYYIEEAQQYPSTDFRMLFTSNHDENSWAGTEKERMGAADTTFAALCYIMPGMPLAYSGQEIGFDRRLEFFSKDSIDWTDRGHYTDFYRRMNSLRHSCSALASGERGGEVVELPNNRAASVFSLVRDGKGDRVAAIFNLTDKPIDVTVDFDSYAGTYRDATTDTQTVVAAKSHFALRAWDYVIYTTKLK